MSVATVVTRGFGSFGTVNFLPTLGYGDYGGTPPEPTPTTGTGGALWAKGRGALKLRRRPLTYSETEELAVRMQAIAAAKALEAIPMDRISDADGHVIGDDPFDDDDLLLQAVILRVLH